MQHPLKTELLASNGIGRVQSGRSPPPASLAPAVQLFFLQFSRALLADLFVLLAMGPLAVHAAVLDEAAGRAVLELDGAPLAVNRTSPAVGAHVCLVVVDCNATHAISALAIQGSDDCPQACLQVTTDRGRT